MPWAQLINPSAIRKYCDKYWVSVEIRLISIPSLFSQLHRLRHLESIPSSALSPIEGTNPKPWHASLLCRALSSQRCGGLSVRATTKRMGGKLSPPSSRVISPCSVVEKCSHNHASLFFAAKCWPSMCERLIGFWFWYENLNLFEDLPWQSSA